MLVALQVLLKTVGTLEIEMLVNDFPYSYHKYLGALLLSTAPVLERLGP